PGAVRAAALADEPGHEGRPLPHPTLSTVGPAGLGPGRDLGRDDRGGRRVVRARGCQAPVSRSASSPGPIGPIIEADRLSPLSAGGVPMSDSGAGPSRDGRGGAGAPEDLAPPDGEPFLRRGDRSLARRAVDDTAAYLILCAALALTTPILRDHTLLAVGTILGFAAIGGARFVLSR